MTDADLLRSLKQALERDPRNGPLWLHYGELLAAAGRRDEAIGALRAAIELLGDGDRATLRLVALLREKGELAEALIRAEALRERTSSPALSLELARILRDRGDLEQARHHYGDARSSFPAEVDAELAALAPQGPAGSAPPSEAVAAEVAPAPSDQDWASQFDWEDLRLTFDDVAGLDDVKRQIHLRIIAPFKSPDVYRAFRRQSGGGLLLYGPPGCGKTFLARATAGECGARFVCASIHEVVDKYWGESEKMVHSLFEEARRRAPTVLFFDEFDALGSNRGRSESQFWKVLVNQLLQEMDGMRGRNEDVLVFAATNMPWHVDAAFRRPGRFDRVLFVPPPDLDARIRILRDHTKKVPGADALDLRAIAERTELFTGADLAALAERAAERALESSLATGVVEPVTQQDFARELPRINSSAHEWFATARNYAKYGNEGGQYDELRDFLKRIKKW